jgi:hypothetical protein
MDSDLRCFSYTRTHKHPDTGRPTDREDNGISGGSNSESTGFRIDLGFASEGLGTALPFYYLAGSDPI